MCSCITIIDTWIEKHHDYRCAKGAEEWFGDKGIVNLVAGRSVPIEYLNCQGVAIQYKRRFRW